MSGVDQIIAAFHLFSFYGGDDNFYVTQLIPCVLLICPPPPLYICLQDNNKIGFILERFYSERPDSKYSFTRIYEGIYKIAGDNLRGNGKIEMEKVRRQADREATTISFSLSTSMCCFEESHTTDCLAFPFPPYCLPSMEALYHAGTFPL